MTCWFRRRSYSDSLDGEPTSVSSGRRAQTGQHWEAALMTPCETYALLDRVDDYRERIYRWVLPVLFAAALVDVGITNPWALYEAMKWPVIVVGSVAALDLLLWCVVWIRRCRGNRP